MVSVTLCQMNNGTLFSYSLVMYPIDRRKVAVRMYSILQSQRKVAYLLNISHSTVSRWLHSPERKPYPKRMSKSEKIVKVLKEVVSSNPFTTSKELQTLFVSSMNIHLSRELIRVAMQKSNLTYKKAKYFSRPSQWEEKLNAFLRQRDYFIAQKYSFICIDETSFGRHGRNAYGYAEKGKPLLISKHQPRMTTSSLLAAMGRTQMLGTFIKQGSINTGVFLNFLISLNLPENTVIVLDNVRFHHASCIKDYITSRKCYLLFTPPYSPWFQPIEGVFSIMKRTYYQNHTIGESIQSVQCHHFTSFFDKAFSIRQQPTK